MKEEESQKYSKGNSVELRIILLGDVKVGKKSLVQRFKLVKCSDTKKINLQGFSPKKMKKKSVHFNKKKLNKNESPTKTKNTTTHQSAESKEEEENEEEKLKLLREARRYNCMTFSKVYNLGFNSLDISFYPCGEEEQLPYDYELKEDDDFYEFEREYRVSIRQMIRELEGIIMKPVDDPKAQLEFLFLLCFDLSNMASFDKLLVHFSQINKHFKLSRDYKMVLVGTKMDKKTVMNKEEKEHFERFKSKFQLNYYEVSSLMFFNFDAFFEKLILDNFGQFPIFNEFKEKFHDIIVTKRTFANTKRPEFGGDDNPGPNQYNNNPYQYPDDEKEFLKIFQNKDKYRRNIFINKRSLLYPPIKLNEKDLLIQNTKKKSSSIDNKQELKFCWDMAKREDIKASLELQSSKPGYTLGVQTFKPLGLSKDRERLRKIRERQRIEELGSNIILTDERKTFTEENINEKQNSYEKNRKNYRDKILNGQKMREDDLKDRHNEVNQKNLDEYNEKLIAFKDRQEKYEKILQEKEKNREKLRNDNYLKNNIKLYTKYQEPKCRFYDPIPSISTNKGFTFGKKYDYKDKEIFSPDYPTFLTDFEKLIRKNKKRVIIKPTEVRNAESPKKVSNQDELLDKMKKFEERRLNNKKTLYNEFLEDRKYKKDNVVQKKKEIKIKQNEDLKEQIQRTYKNDPHYYIRDINYTQVESTSPSFTMRGKFEIGSIFYFDKQEKNSENSNTEKKPNKLENPNFALVHPRYPAFSFSRSHRFNSISIEARKKRIMNLGKNSASKRYETEAMEDSYNSRDKDFGVRSLYYYGSQDSQSFLKMQTTMGTGKKLESKDNGFPGPNKYIIRGFADDVKLKGDKINETRIMLKEKKKLEDLEKIRMAKLREERFDEKKKNLRLSIKEIINGSDNNINNENNNKTEPSGKENNSEIKNENNEENSVDNEDRIENQE